MNKKGSPGNGNYVVGKGRPPLSTRWKSGQSGNPKGRPKGVKNMMTYFHEALSRKIDVKVGGKIRAMSAREGIAMNTTNLALKDHREFAMASGEMTDAKFLAFNGAWIATVLPYLCDGGILGTFIDWRGLPTVHSAVGNLGLVPLNLIVWAKTNAGMGSLYRSQHELLPLFTKGSRRHVNNIELGKRGRWRSNVWTYPGASSLGSDARRGLKDHPTVKPTAMLEDALLDLTNRGDLVIDPFLGSGSTLIAAEATGRVCRGVELDPLYVDVIMRRYEAATGDPAVLVETEETFQALGARRGREAAPI